jgi:hypothetical protein
VRVEELNARKLGFVGDKIHGLRKNFLIFLKRETVSLILKELDLFLRVF